MTAPPTIGVLRVGAVDSKLASGFGEYPSMFERLLNGDGPPLRFQTWDVVGGVLPNAPADADAWLITGSRHGVYDDLPWIAPLKAFLRAAYDGQVPIVGICFGHQILAEALGGRVEKSAKGWGCGAHRYDVVAGALEGQVGAPASVALNAMHQDQVVEKPPMAKTFLTSEFCEYAGLVYPGGRALSIQAHPEFNAEFERTLIDLLEGRLIPPERAEMGRRSQDGAVIDADWARQWMRAVLEPSPRMDAAPSQSRT